MKKIILDTNFLLIPFQFRVDIFSEIDRIVHFNYELCVIDKTVGELESMLKKKTKESRYAKAALACMHNKKIRKLTTATAGHTDDLILELAKSSKSVVATQDMPLKKRLKQQNIPIITLRQKKYLFFETFI